MNVAVCTLDCRIQNSGCARIHKEISWTPSPPLYPLSPHQPPIILYFIFGLLSVVNAVRHPCLSLLPSPPVQFRLIFCYCGRCFRIILFTVHWAVATDYCDFCFFFLLHQFCIPFVRLNILANNENIHFQRCEHFSNVIFNKSSNWTRPIEFLTDLEYKMIFTLYYVLEWKTTNTESRLETKRLDRLTKATNLTIWDWQWVLEMFSSLKKKKNYLTNSAVVRIVLWLFLFW